MRLKGMLAQEIMIEANWQIINILGKISINYWINYLKKKKASSEWRKTVPF